MLHPGFISLQFNNLSKYTLLRILYFATNELFPSFTQFIIHTFFQFWKKPTSTQRTLHPLPGWVGRTELQPAPAAYAPTGFSLWTRRPPQRGALDERAQRNKSSQAANRQGSGRPGTVLHWGRAAKLRGILATARTPTGAGDGPAAPVFGARTGPARETGGRPDPRPGNGAGARAAKPVCDSPPKGGPREASAQWAVRRRRKRPEAVSAQRSVGPAPRGPQAYWANGSPGSPRRHCGATGRAARWTAAGNDRRRRTAKTDRADQAASRSARDPARGR